MYPIKPGGRPFLNYLGESVALILIWAFYSSLHCAGRRRCYLFELNLFLTFLPIFNKFVRRIPKSQQQSRLLPHFTFMNILKIVSGKVEIRSQTGNHIRTIGNGDAVVADFNAAQDLVLITTVQGKVEIRTHTGNHLRTIGNGDATQARWMGADVAITTNRGKTEIRSATGNHIRTI